MKTSAPAATPITIQLPDVEGIPFWRERALTTTPAGGGAGAEFVDARKRYTPNPVYFAAAAVGLPLDGVTKPFLFEKSSSTSHAASGGAADAINALHSLGSPRQVDFVDLGDGVVRTRVDGRSQFVYSGGADAWARQVVDAARLVASSVS